ncbi:galactokinase [Boudabousia liubingyangii]|uniref:Galactokinase n=1 Tax=Boudabousia liubingyangii TaxID=1921764 RepID=A0A1Q5PJX2_9ACTO|nr:galactokinase [Boudabousia liubingyangii]OKL46188.1 galactokinase [Boudabousia liubingyangii]
MAQLQWLAPESLESGAQAAVDLFKERYGYEPVGVWSAPGRVNLIGEHTDYNGGMCLPIALPHRAFVAVAPREDRLMHFTDRFVPEGFVEVDLDKMGPRGTEGELTDWTAYLAGVAWAMEQVGIGPISGFDLALFSCVPRGGGLSSSAALECATAVALDEIFNLGLAGTVENPDDEGRARLVEVCRAAENQIAGAPTGGLDQSASLRCAEGAALELDCRDNSTALVPFELEKAGLALLVIDTRAPHSLNDGQYKARRDACEAAAEVLGVNQLVDVDFHELDDALEKLSDPVQVQRVRHVVTEIERTHEAIAALRSGPLEGEVLDHIAYLFDASHDSLRDDYEVTCPELDLAVNVARREGSHGARMTGGGFGGSAIALVDKERVEEVAEAIAQAYQEAGFNEPAFLRALPSAPAGRVK